MDFPNRRGELPAEFKGSVWLDQLSIVLARLERRWSMKVDIPFTGEEGSSAFVAPVTLPSGIRAVLKIGMPHIEAEHEIHGLRFWDGNPTVRVLDADDDLGAMLLERCEPGTPLRTIAEADQDVIIAAMLHRIWRLPPAPHPFRPLSTLTQCWTEETLSNEKWWPDSGLVREGLKLFKELSRSAPVEVLLATDLHAGNILRSKREPWLMIDPKPFVGDPAYDATQHLLNCGARLLSDPSGTIRRLSDLLLLDYERVRLWTFARTAADPRSNWADSSSLALARALAP